MSTNRPPFTAVAVGLNGAGAVTVAGTQVGDLVVPMFSQVTGGSFLAVTVAADTFERVVSVAGQVQQNSTANLSTLTITFMIYPQGWKSIQ